MFPRRGLHARTATSLTLTAASALVLIAASLSLAQGAHAAQASSHARHSATRLVASDNMQRRVQAGLGRATRGGRYDVSSLRGARVRNHRAVLGPVTAGHQISAWLPQLRVHDERVRTNIRLVSHDPLGGGEYFAIGLRHVTRNAGYLAKVHLVSGQGVFVGLSRVRDYREHVLTGERRVLPSSALHRWIEVQATVTGNDPVRIGMRIWSPGHARPATDQLQYRDRSASRISGAGSVSFQSYLSRRASGGSVVDFKHVRVWRVPGAPSSGTHSGSTPPSSTPPSSTPPSSTPPSSTPPSSTPPSSTPPSSTPPSSTPPSSTPPTPPATGTAADAGSAPLGQASYPVPANAVFVATTGSDSAAGTQSAPLRTLAHALSIAPSGGTIVLRAGSYNESVQDVSKPLTIENYPGETVWLDGSTAVTGWTQQGSTWVHNGWTPQFSSVPSYTSTVSTAAYWSFINAAHPMAAHPDQMWMNGSALAQVGSADAVGPGDFYADYDNDSLVIGSDPTGQQMRASNLGVALTSYASNFTIRGIGVRRYATAVNQFGALRLMGADNEAQNVVSTQNATTGIMLGGNAPVIDHDTVTDNGMLGLTGTYVDGITVDGLLAQGNNTEGFSLSPVSGGMKIARTRGVTVENSQFIDNTGPGAWFDESVYNATIVGNVMSDNVGHGMSYEISSTALIANNVVENNGGDGFKINDSNLVKVWNNTIMNNGRDIEVVEDIRRGSNLSDPGHNPHVAQPDPTEPWTITDDSIMNNVFSPAPGSYQLYVRDYSGQYSANQIGLTVNGNAFLCRTSAPMVVWGQASGNPQVFSTAAAFVSATGQGSGNADASTTQGLMSATGGIPLPGNVAAAVGQPTGVAHLGAF